MGALQMSRMVMFPLCSFASRLFNNYFLTYY